MRECNEQYREVNNTRLCYFEWGKRQQNSRTIFLVHATGFHARCWDQTITHLGDNHVIAIDQRGHGRSSNTGPFGWKDFGADIGAFLELLDLNDIIAVGHSMGGHAVTQAMSKASDRFSRAVLVDPVIFDPEFYDLAGRQDSPDENEEHPVVRRRNEFADEFAAYENFEGRSGYSSWTEACLRDYCRFGLLPSKTGAGYVLACPPSVEAAIYGGSSSLDIYDKISEVQVPVTVLRAHQTPFTDGKKDFGNSPTWSDLAGCFPRGRDVYLPELTHFMPMEDPKLVANFILDG